MLQLLFLVGFSALTFSKTTDIQMFCPSHDSQKTFDIKLLMGTWHIMEIVNHRSTEEIQHPHEFDLDLCPTIQLVQDDYSNIRIVWVENTETLYYHAKRTDSKSPGFWVASGPHESDEAERYGHHSHYSGTIEVMKAVRNHAVLTFCKSDHTNSQLFSIVMARDTWMPRAETRGVNKMLATRGLKPVIIKRTCNGAASNIITTSVVLLLTTLVLIR